MNALRDMITSMQQSCFSSACAVSYLIRLAVCRYSYPSRFFANVTKKQTQMSAIAGDFERLNIRHLASKHKGQAHCQRLFKENLKRWVPSRNQSVLGSATYTDVCTGERNKQCKYVIRVFSGGGGIAFQHELKILERLQARRVDFVPRVHTAFFCGRHVPFCCRCFAYSLCAQVWPVDTGQMERQPSRFAFQAKGVRFRSRISAFAPSGYSHADRATPSRNLLRCASSLI